MPADHLTVAFAERLAAKRIDDRVAGAVQVAKPPALVTQTFSRMLTKLCHNQPTDYKKSLYCVPGNLRLDCSTGQKKFSSDNDDDFNNCLYSAYATHGHNFKL